MSAIPISFLFRGHTDDIPLLRLLLSPDTDNIKKVFPGDPHDENDIKVKFEGLDDFLGGPAPCDIYLGRVEDKHRHKKQVLFWQLTGDKMYTPDEDKANMTEMEVAIRIHISGELLGAKSSGGDGYHLNNSVRPKGDVTIIFPVLVNHKAIERKCPLLVFKAKAADSDGTETSKKRTAVPISQLKNWDKQIGQIQKKAKGCA